MTQPQIAVLIVAAGRGLRAGRFRAGPKQYWTLGGTPVLRRTAERFVAFGLARVRVVIHPDDAALYETALAGLPLAAPVFGGATRQESVLNGLESLADEAPDFVLIHDGVRPFVSAGTIRTAIAALGSEGVLVGRRITDTLAATDDGGLVTGAVPRDNVWRAETPQGFPFAAVLDAHRRAAAAGRFDFTDDASLFRWAGGEVRMVEAMGENPKLTTAEDFAAADMRLLAELADIRTGNGYDVHRLVPGDGVTLGGVLIPHTRTLEGHSDADAGLHALTDAVLGALGEGDIGQHFPPSDPRWRGAASSAFLAEAVRRVRARGGAIAHLDLSIIAEAPKIGPHREAMRVRIAEICGIGIGRVGVKATTNEGLGFAGRREGIAAIATATIRLPLVAE